MSADIINLRRARKAKTRSEREKDAEQNRIRFGRSSAEKRKEADERDRAAAHLDRHRIEPDKD
jgi:hypothetical protein